MLQPFPQGARPIRADELRKAGESADGRRGRPLQLVYGVRPGNDIGAGDYLMLDLADPVDRKPFETWTLYEVVGAESEWTCPDHERERETVVKVRVGLSEEHQLDSARSDSLFWSESAVEKFLFPYYVRHLNKRQFDQLYSLYMDGKRNSAGELLGPVMALIHLPTSDYDDETRRVLELDEDRVFGRLYEIGVIRADRTPPQSVPAYLFEAMGPAIFGLLS